jgi:hypothetical protein
MKKQYMLMFLFIALLLSGCSDSDRADEEKGYQEDPSISIVKDEVLLFQEDESTNDYGTLYLKTSQGEPEVLASNVAPITFKYLYNTKTLLYFDKDKNLMVKDAAKVATKISNDVYPDSIIVSEDESTILFLKTVTPGDFSSNSGDLYYLVLGGDKDKIASDINQYSYSLTKNGQITTFLDLESSLYRKSADLAGKEKIASNVTKFLTSSDGNITILEDKDGSVYIKKATLPDKEKITSQGLVQPFFSDDNLTLAYLDEFRDSTLKGELILLKEGYEKVKIASDVTSFQIPVTSYYIYFLNEDKNLYMKEIRDAQQNTKAKKSSKDKDQTTALMIFNPAEKVKLDDEVTGFKVAPDGSSIIYADSDENLFLKRLGEQKVKIGSNVDSYYLYNDTVLFLDKEMVLFTIDLTLDPETKKAGEKTNNPDLASDQSPSPVKEKVKLAEKVEVYSADQSLTYLTYKLSSGEVFTRTNKQQPPVKVIDNADEYNTVYFLDYLLYEKLVTINSLVGYWKYSDKETEEFMYFQFTKDHQMIGYDEQGESTGPSFSLINATSHSVDLSYSDGLIEKFELINKDSLTFQVDGETTVQQLTRVNKEEVDMYKKEIKDKIEVAAREDAKSSSLTAEDAMKIVESLDPDNYFADHESSEYDITTLDGVFYYYVNYSAASGFGGSVFVSKKTGEVFGYTMGTENDPNAPFPDFSNQIK